MLEFLFLVCMVWVFGKMLIVGVKATWGISKILFTAVLLPLILLAMLLGGLIYIAFPIVLVIGIVELVTG